MGKNAGHLADQYTGLDDQKELFKFRFFSCISKKYVEVVIK